MQHPFDIVTPLDTIHTLSRLQNSVTNGYEGLLRTSSAGEQDVVLLVLLLIFLWISAVAISGRNFFAQIGEGLFEEKLRGNFATSSVVEKLRLRSALLAQTFVLSGVILSGYIEVNSMGWGHLAYAKELNILVLSVGALLFFLSQWLLYRLLGYVFDLTMRWRIWLESFVVITCYTGVLLLPFVLLQIFYPPLYEDIGSIIAVIYLIGRIIFIYNGVKIFFADVYSIFYFILYLCTVEIIPLVLLYRGFVSL